MIYRLNKSAADPKSMELEPVPFQGLAAMGMVEKDLEDLIAAHLLDMLFEGAALMPVFQERQQQPEADLYALDEKGDLTIFELKRGHASADAMLQALRYGQAAGQWTYNNIQERYRTYTNNSTVSLDKVHCEAFNLDH